MQGSFWKTVAVVGVIGIGSLAILEVQNRLDNSTAATNPSELDDAATNVASTGDQTVEGMLTDSEFDRLLNGDAVPTPATAVAATSAAPETQANAQFNMSEPEVATVAKNEAPIEIFNSEPVPAQDAMPPVNTTVAAEALVKGGNPFAALGNTVAASYQAAEAKVETVGFQQESFAGDAAPAGFANFEETPSTAEPEHTHSEPNRPEPAPHTAAATVLAPTPQTAAVPGNLQFFGAGGEAEKTTADAAVQPQPTAAGQLLTTAQFYSDEAAPVIPVSEGSADDNSFDEATPMFNEDVTDTTPKPTPVTPDRNVPGEFGGQPFPANSEPVPFSEDEVPVPRNPAPGPEPIPENEPSGFDDGPLPWAVDEPDNSRADDRRLEPVPQRDDTNSLSIPGLPETNPRGNGSEPRSNFTPQPDSRDEREFNPPPRDVPRQNYNEPGIPLNHQSREFDSKPIRQESAPRRLEPLDERRPEPQPEPFNDRRFEMDTRPVQPRNDSIDIRSLPKPRRDDPPRDNSFSNDLDDRNFEIRPDNRLTPEDRGRDSRSADVRQISGRMSPNLVLEKTAPKNATVGAPLDYQIYVKNEGDATAYEVVVDDDVTTAARVEGTSPPSDFNKSTGKLIWKFAEIQPGRTEKITVRMTPTGEGVLDGVASVRFKSRVKATTVITAPKLRLQMQGPDEVRLGQPVAYTYIITNEGSGEARDVFIRTLLPDSGGLKHTQGRDLEYEIQAMKPGEQREITLAVVAAEPGEHSAQAEISAAGGATDQAAWRTKVIGAQLQIVRRGPKRRFVNRAATYENIITNETNFDALDAKVVEQIPEGMRFMGATKGGQYDDAARTVTWSINRLGPNRQEQLQLELMPLQAGNMESTVKILENVGVQSEDYVSTTVIEDLHNVSATISQLDGPVPTGETFGFTINIDNRGTADATDVELRVEVPEEIQVVGAGNQENRATIDPRTVNTVQYSTILRIEPGRKQSFELKLKGTRPVRNGMVQAKLMYKQMSKPLIVSESVTVYSEQL